MLDSPVSKRAFVTKPQWWRRILSTYNDHVLTCFLLQVAIPIWGDQLANGAEIEKLGIGVNLDYKTLSEAGLLENVQKVLGQKKYQDKIDHLSEILTDEIDR